MTDEEVVGIFEAEHLPLETQFSEAEYNNINNMFAVLSRSV